MVLCRDALVALWGPRTGACVAHYCAAYPGYDAAYLIRRHPVPTDLMVARATRIQAHAMWVAEGKPDGCAGRHWRVAEAAVDRHVAVWSAPQIGSNPRACRI